MVSFVFVTEPLIAFLYDEPGHEAVADLLAQVEGDDATGLLTGINAAELTYLIARIEGADGEPTPDSLRVADRDIRSLTRHGVTIERANWRLAGEIKAHGSLSVADAFAVALAHDHEATLIVGADDDFETLPVDVAVRAIRSEGV